MLLLIEDKILIKTRSQKKGYWERKVTLLNFLTKSTLCLASGAQTEIEGTDSVDRKEATQRDKEYDEHNRRH